MITDYPLIAITEVLDMPSTDNTTYNYVTGELTHGPCRDILEEKLDEVFEKYAWAPDEVFRKPCWIFSRSDLYGKRFDDTDNIAMIGNGHHRVAFQALVQGALFVHYSNDSDACS